MILDGALYDRVLTAAAAHGPWGEDEGRLVAEGHDGDLYAWPPKQRFWWTPVDLADRSARLYEAFAGERLTLVEIDAQLHPAHRPLERALDPPAPLGARQRPSTLAAR